MLVNGAPVINIIEHAADLFSIDQPVLEGESAIGRPDVGISKNSQLHTPEFGNVHHFFFSDPNITSPAAAGTTAGSAGVLIECEGEVRVNSHEYSVFDFSINRVTGSHLKHFLL